MTATTPSAAGGGEEDLRRFQVGDDFAELKVVIEADFNKLTVERATEINDFWSSAKDCLAAESGDVRRAVIRRFGAMAIRHFLADGGASFVPGSSTAPYWNKDLHDVEGYGGLDDTLYGWCGMRVIRAECEVPGFDEVTLSEVIE